MIPELEVTDTELIIKIPMGKSFKEHHFNLNHCSLVDTSFEDHLFHKYGLTEKDVREAQKIFERKQKLKKLLS